MMLTKASSWKNAVLVASLGLVVGAAPGIAGCGPGNLSQESPAYKKLPPGEGERRLQETLAKRNGGGRPSTPAPGPATAPGSGATAGK